MTIPILLATILAILISLLVNIIHYIITQIKINNLIRFNLNWNVLIQINDEAFKRLEKTVGTNYIIHCIKSRKEQHINPITNKLEDYYNLQMHNVMELFGDSIMCKRSINSNILLHQKDLTPTIKL